MRKLIFGIIAGFAWWQAAAADLPWQTDFPKALAQAKAEHKLVFLDFGGSDWCPGCLKLQADVYSKPEFIAYEKTNLVLVQLDFPYHKPQSAELKAANRALADKYLVVGFPTLLALKPDGTTAWRSDGYPQGGLSGVLTGLAGAQKP